MIAEETWRLYTARWGALTLGGLFALLVNLVLSLLSSLLVAPVLIASSLNLLGLAGTGGLGGMIRAFAGVGLVALLVLAAAIALAPLGQGGLLHAVVQVQRDRPVHLPDLWQAGLRYWGRLFRLNLVTVAVGMLLLLLLALLIRIPILGALVGLVGSGMIMLVLIGYGPYIIVSEDVGTTEAVGRAFRILTGKFVDVLLTLLVLAAAGLAFGLVTGLLAFLPVLEWLIPYLTQLVVAPLTLLYLAVRYQRNLGGGMPPGGRGRFDAGPPPGA